MSKHSQKLSNETKDRNLIKIVIATVYAPLGLLTILGTVHAIN